MAYRRFVSRTIFTSICMTLLIMYIVGLHQYVFCLPYNWFYKHPGPGAPLLDLINSYEQDLISPVSSFTYKYIHNCKHKCINTDVDVLFIVKSKAEHFEGRTAIRSSWGNVSRFSYFISKIVFVIGKTAEGDLQQKINNESYIDKDIVQGDFADTYSNLTIKTLMTLHWVFHYCPSSEYVVYLDADMYVSIKNILTFLRDPTNYPHSTQKIKQHNLYAGYMSPYPLPTRVIFSKYYISVQEYPYSIFPPYVYGSLSMFSRNSINYLYYGTLFTEFFKFDDIFLGMAAKKAGIVLHNIDKYYSPFVSYSPEDFKYIFCMHKGINEPKQMLEIWTEQYDLGNA